MSSLPVACIVHISDLHMGKHYSDEGRRELCSTWYHIRRGLLDGEVEPQGHDLQILKNLETYIAMRLNEFRIELGINEHIPTTYVVSGDIATYQADTVVLDNFHYPYLTSDVPTGLHSWDKMGLHIPVDKFVFVPGNHERFAAITLQSFVASRFGSGGRGERYDQIGKFDYAMWVPGPQNLFFCCLDTGLTERVGNLGQGNIIEQQARWVQEIFTTMSNAGGNILGHNITAEAFQSALKILVTHHCVSPDTRHFIKGHGISRRWLKVHNVEALGGVLPLFNVVLFGHIHVAHGLKQNQTMYLSAGTVSEKTFKVGKNSFSIYCMYDDSSIHAENYVWNGYRFLKELCDKAEESAW